MTGQTTILEVKDIRKYFGGVKAVDGVSLSIDKGEVHAIVGENGAGKSTLMNVLAGIYPPDSGQIYIQGKAYSPESPRDARLEGINIVFQELALFPALQVDANLFAGKEIQRGLRLDLSGMRYQAQSTLVQMNVDLNPAEYVGDLSIGQQQWVEIARAMTDQSKVLILDEPNSALNQYETEELFKLIQHLKSQGITVIYISHRLEEVFQIADRITVMRDGQNIGTWNANETTISEIVAAMVGHQVDELFTRTHIPPSKLVLEVKDLTVNDRLKTVSFPIHEGEVVGVAGLAGSGITELFEAIFGVQKASGGEIFLAGRKQEINSPHEAMNQQVAMVPADRRGLGLMLNWSVAKNNTLAVLRRLSRFGILNHKQLKKLAQDNVDQLRIVTESLDKLVLFLSGGNQQKVLLSRWLATDPRLLILDDPTRGIDVGAKQEIYEIIDKSANEEVAILLTSSEIDEIIALSDRILILRKGQLVADLPTGICDKELVMEFVAGDPVKGKEKLEANLQQFHPSTTVKPNIYNLSSPPKRSSQPDQTTTSQPIKTQEDSRPEKSLENSGKEISSPSKRSSTLRRLWSIREVGVLQALILTCLMFSLLTPYFLTISNISLILRQMSILAIITMGMTFVLASGEVDLSVGWIFNMVMSTMAFISVKFGIDPWITIPIGLLTGAILGALNGSLAVVLGLPTIIITLATMTVFRGMALSLNQGRTISKLPESSFFLIGSDTLGPISYMTIIMILIVIICAWIWRNTPFARHLLEMGGNRTAAERVGIRINRLRIAVMAFSGLMCGIAGVIALAFLKAADAQSGKGYELAAIAAAIIGGAQLGGGAGTIWGSLIGIALITAIQNGLVLMGLRPAWQIGFTGLVILAAVTIDYLTRTRRAKTSREMLTSNPTPNPD